MDESTKVVIELGQVGGPSGKLDFRFSMANHLGQIEVYGYEPGDLRLRGISLWLQSLDFIQLRRIVATMDRIILKYRSTGEIENFGPKTTTGRYSEFESAFRRIAQAVSGSKGLTEKEKNEHLELIGMVVLEAAQPAPSRIRLRTIFEGLVVVLRAVPDVAGVINPTLSSLIDRLISGMTGTTNPPVR